jgi:F-type H+-transporting ATPase subunit delta
VTSTIGRNYARALFDLAQETGSLDAVEQDLRAARAVLHDDRGAREFLGNRLIGRSTKKAVIRAGLEGKVDERVLTTLFIMADRGRMRLLGEMTEELERLARLARGVRKVTVASAFPLGAEEQARVGHALEARYGGTVEMVAEVRPSLVGGVVTASEGQEIELSIEGQLKRLRESLAE